MSSHEMIRKLLADPATSYWLKEAMNRLQERDALDAFNDATTLLMFCRLRKNEAESAHAQLKMPELPKLKPGL